MLFFGLKYSSVLFFIPFSISEHVTDSFNVCAHVRSALMVLYIKYVVRSTTREHVKQKYLLASPLKRILWNKDSDSGSTGFVFESICAKLVLYDF